MNNYKKNKKILEDSYNYKQDMEHDACGVGLIASTNGKNVSRVLQAASREPWPRLREA